MRRALAKFLCCIAIGLQVLTSAVSAQGLVVCRPADGTVHIENRTQQRDCDDCGHIQPDQATDNNQAVICDSSDGCVDLPVGEGHTSVGPGQRSSIASNPVQWLVVLPQFLQVTPASFAPIAGYRANAIAAKVPDAMLDSLSSVILVI